jgi:DtxR family Mn-dependent transcriptional regulator
LHESAGSLSGSLEDYLETVYELVREKKLARVKDIAERRGVRAASVTPAMKRLAELGLIEYVQREYIDLTEEGARQARRVLAKHVILTCFFEEFLSMPAEAAEADACAMEHSLSAEAMERMVRFFEFLRVSPRAKAFLRSFREFSEMHDRARPVGHRERAHVVSLSVLKPGDKARVTHVHGRGVARQRLLDTGILPDAMVSVERVVPRTRAVLIDLHGFQISLSHKEADSIMVVQE